jgi:hypothetical protein
MRSNPTKLQSYINKDTNGTQNVSLTCMIHPIDPSLAIGLGALYRSNIMGLAVIIPSQDLNDVYLIPHGD